MRSSAFLLVLSVLPVCSSLKASPPPDFRGPMTYEVFSWGRILLHWQINPDGSGEIWKGSNPRDPRQIGKYRLRLSAKALQLFAVSAENARLATHGGIPCKKNIYDLPYGSLTWNYSGAQETYTFDAGCRSNKGDAAMDLIKTADDVVETMAAIDAEPYMTQAFP